MTKPKPSTPGFLLSNVHSLRHKTDELYMVEAKNNSAVVAVTETWLDEDVLDSSILLPGYNVPCLDRTGTRGGGVALYAHDNMTQE